MSDIFEQASKGGLRFMTDRGTLMVEDLWHIEPLSIVDDMYVSFKKELNDSGEGESLLSNKLTVDPKLKLSIAICKRIVEVRMEEANAVEKALAKKQKNARIMEIIANKKDGALQESTVEELEAMLEED